MANEPDFGVMARLNFISKGQCLLSYRRSSESQVLFR